MTTSLVQWLACLTTDHEVAGSFLGTSTNFKCGLGLEWGPPSLVRTIGQLLDGEVADLLKKVDIIRLAIAKEKECEKDERPCDLHH